MLQNVTSHGNEIETELGEGGERFHSTNEMKAKESAWEMERAVRLLGWGSGGGGGAW